MGYPSIVLTPEECFNIIDLLLAKSGSRRPGHPGWYPHVQKLRQIALTKQSLALGVNSCKTGEPF